MTTILRNFWRTLAGSDSKDPPAAPPVPVEQARRATPQMLNIDILPNDPVMAYFQSAPGAVDVERLEMDSPALRQLKAAGVRMIVPLVSQGELIGLLNLGARMSEQEYALDDRILLNNLAAQASVAVDRTRPGVKGDGAGGLEVVPKPGASNVWSRDPITRFTEPMRASSDGAVTLAAARSAELSKHLTFDGALLTIAPASTPATTQLTPTLTEGLTDLAGKPPPNLGALELGPAGLAGARRSGLGDRQHLELLRRAGPRRPPHCRRDPLREEPSRGQGLAVERLGLRARSVYRVGAGVPVRSRRRS